MKEYKGIVMNIYSVIYSLNVIDQPCQSHRLIKKVIYKLIENENKSGCFFFLTLKYIQT